jgi:hypothetical protein
VSEWKTERRNGITFSFEIETLRTPWHSHDRVICIQGRHRFSDYPGHFLCKRSGKKSAAARGLMVKFVPMKYTQSMLDKLETIPEQSGYVLRYERGTFQSGYCILESKKVVVLNKFLQTEGRINTLLDLIPQLDIKPDQLSDESRKLHHQILSKLETEQQDE